MEIFGYNKPIKYCKLKMVYRDLVTGHSLSNPYAIYCEVTRFYSLSDSIILDLSPEPKTFKEEQFGTLTDSAVLYFDKSATFPRYKLEGTNYTRCIKPNKADFIVVNPDIKPEIDWNIYTIYEDADNLYVFREKNDMGLIDAIKREGLNLSLVYSGKVCKYKQNEKILLSVPNKPLISDKVLSEHIDKNLNMEMTEEDAKQIITMLNSSDNSVVDLGLKLLAGFSATLTPFSIKTILLTNRKWTESPSRTSVGVKSMLNTLGIDPYCATRRFPYNITELNDGKQYEEKDLKMGRSLLRENIEQFFNNTMLYERDIVEGPNIGFKVTIHVEEK